MPLMDSAGSKVYVLKPPGANAPVRPLSRDYAQELNPQQLAAVEVVDGPALVIAGAGSGKTRVLVYRVARLIDLGIDPASILLLTFTRKAAQEMLGRAGMLIGPQSGRVTGGTFHSVANTLLRRHGRAIGLEPGFTILDRSDSEGLVGLVRDQHGIGAGKSFPRKRTIADIFSKAANTLQPLEDVLLNDYEHFSGELGALTALHTAYETVKRQRQLVDYDDLLLRLRELLAADEPSRRVIAGLYRYLLVDEYQDTNRLQADMVRRLAAAHENVMVVGDDSQSIYSFRGATFRNIMEFPTLFPGARIFKLEENYRSTQPILGLANAILEGAADKYSKTLFTQKAQGERPALVQTVGENPQSRFVVQKVLELHEEEGVPLDKMAVLFRSSFHAFDLEVELTKQGIPFLKRGGFKFIETAHVKDLLAHARIVHNTLDTVSWHRVLQLVQGVGPKRAGVLIAQLAAAGAPYEALRQADGRAAAGLRALAEALDAAAGTADAAPAEVMQRLLDYYYFILKEEYDDYPKLMRDLEHLVGMAERCERLEDFLAALTLEPPETSVTAVEAADRDEARLVLSTIHSAKGLEWQCVFVLWLVDGRFPSSYSFRTDEELEEERRLLYVAVTRAERLLYLTFPVQVYDKASGIMLSKPSRFLDEVPADLVEAVNVVEEAAGGLP